MKCRCKSCRHNYGTIGGRVCLMEGRICGKKGSKLLIPHFRKCPYFELR